MYSIECVLLQPHPTFHHLSSLSQFPTFHPPPCASSLQLLLPGRHPLPSRAYIYINIAAAMFTDSARHGYSLPQNPMQRYGFCIFLTNF